MKHIKRSKSGQRGFTLVELLVAIPISALVVAAATAGIISIVNSRDAGTSMYSLRQVQTAGYWLSTDGYQAQEVGYTKGEITVGPDRGFPLRLWWLDPDTNEAHNVIYTLGGTEGGPRTLIREESITNDITGSSDNSTLTVARYLVDFTYDPDTGAITGNATECRVGIVNPAQGLNEPSLIFKVTAQVGQEYPEERTYNIMLRPDILSEVEI